MKLWCTLILLASPALAQDTIGLGELYEAAITADPRLQRLQLEEAETALRLRNLSTEWLPEIAIEGQAQHQSDVVETPFSQADGSGSPTVPKNTTDISIAIEESLLDASRSAHRKAERARLVETQAEVRTAVAALRREVDEAYFTALSLQEREAEVSAVITSLEARLRDAEARVAERDALPSEAMAIEAALLRHRQEADAFRAQRGAAYERLAALAGRSFSLDDRLAVPDLDAAVAAARVQLDPRGRPEFAQLAATRGSLEAQKALSNAKRWPRLTAYGRVGYGRPGLDFLSDAYDSYWLAGVQLRWQPWDWGRVGRETRILTLKQRAIAAEAEALERSIRRAVANDLATIDQLTETEAIDTRIVELNEAIERESLARYEERVIPAWEYIDRQSDVLDSRLLRAVHRAERARAQARFLTLMGWEVP